MRAAEGAMRASERGETAAKEERRLAIDEGTAVEAAAVTLLPLLLLVRAPCIMQEENGMKR